MPVEHVQRTDSLGFETRSLAGKCSQGKTRPAWSVWRWVRVQSVMIVPLLGTIVCTVKDLTTRRLRGYLPHIIVKRTFELVIHKGMLG